MLSNPTNNLQNRQRQHRRQQSTPTAFEPVKVNNLPNIQKHAHRRGISLDQRRRTPPQDLTVSTTNNQGYQTTQQHILRETQQQRLARPGQNFSNFGNDDENYLNSPTVTPNRQSFDAGQYGGHNSSQFSYPGQINTTMNVNPSTFGSNDFNLFSTDVLTPSAYLDFSAGFDDIQNCGERSGRSSGRRISGGIVDRVTQFENLALQLPHRPITPPNQNAQTYFPPTPADTPYRRRVKLESSPQRFTDNYDSSMEETIKPKNNQRTNTIFDDMRREAENSTIPSPPGSGQILTTNTFDSAPMPTRNFTNMAPMNTNFMKNEEFNVSPQYSPVSSLVSPTVSYASSPEIAPMQLFGDPFVNQPELEPAMSSYPEPSHHGFPAMDSPEPTSPYRRSESVSSINLDESITDTGITIDEIATYISGPDPQDGKWLCLYPECKKRFGRKENIKSHVQTHLGDRQFQCPHCKKCFVRQHDLKRHAKIHSGVKPYPCQCGNSFARHDALTRHRQRGMCIGAFEGVVKKQVKRGRPKKSRPDNEERIKKSSRTRNKNKAMSSASSSTGTESTSGESPRSELDDILDGKSFDNYNYTQTTVSTDNASFDHYSQSNSPETTDCFSPQKINARSPSAYSSHSTYREHRESVVSLSERLPSHPASPAKSVHSYHSPPELCESSSSPTASNHYYDLETVSNHGGEITNMSGLANITEHDDEMFLEAFAAATNAEMTQLEQDPGMLLGKYEDPFGANGSDEMFRSSEDVFFGSP